MSFLKNQVFPIIKMVLIALLFTLVLILTFALITRWASLDSTVVTPVTYVLKCVSVVAACLIAYRKTDNGLIKGLIGGLLYFFLSYFVFAALNKFQNCPFNFIDLVCLTISGGIGGIIAVNLSKKSSKQKE